ncbi:hypothetical protein [Microbacterium radiodurans]|uniref:Uncharacterized protein n=1 Tax=Microbacterium radiodurans TaxID=661398 RepID=A0A5J5IT81_9MICO|nr:hypothetical protein [Microbacterium radiodurans]KAA9089068.1 hypothetical protein F6B42_00745 [Microbacterium radiodurans]
MSPLEETRRGAPRRPGGGVVWARVEDGFHVGSTDGDFVGYIDRQPDGRWHAFDARSRMVGSFAVVTDAMRALSLPAAPAPETPPIDLWEMR